MVRGRTQMKRIENAASRQGTFTKRRNGLLKKAYELSGPGNAEFGLMIFFPRGKLHEFASPSMQKILEKYRKCNNTTQKEDIQCLKQEFENMEEKIRNLESMHRRLLGEGLATCSMKELHQLESQVERGLNQIRARKTKILVDKVEQLERKEQSLREENAFLRKKNVDPENVDAPVPTTPSIGFESIKHIEVQTN